MPPRPHPIVLTALVAACMFVAMLLLPGGLAHASAGVGAQPLGRVHAQWLGRVHAQWLGRVHARWRWPLRGPVAGGFRVTPRAPYARGQRRGIDVAAPPGSAVRAACPGRVTFTGALPRLGLAVSVRCGSLVATYLRLARVAVRRGAIVAPGEQLGTLGPEGLLRLGARRAADRRGYVDPLTLLHDPAPPPPALGPAPRARRPPTAQPTRPRPVPASPRPRFARRPARDARRRLPWPAYPALALIATALPIGGLVHRRRARSRAATSAASRVAENA